MWVQDRVCGCRVGCVGAGKGVWVQGRVCGCREGCVGAGKRAHLVQV